ncbi:dynein associated protein-domain-containing protein [Dichotomocladium elegans]|nr:dynein associated protein-domain-containing protein [Dichotomocladium elegans]
MRARQQQQQQQQYGHEEELDDEDGGSANISYTEDDDDDQQTPSDDVSEEEESSDKDTPATPVDQNDDEPLAKDIVESAAASQHQHHRERPQASYGALAPTMPISKSEQMVPLKDYEELRFKLKILEAKRQEDRERYREHEKVKEEAEQFLTLRNKLQDKIAELQRDLRDTKRELKETTAEKESLEQSFSEMADSLEMMTLDKEVAEERAESLQEEVDLLKDKIQEISVDLDVLKREADILNRAPDVNGDGRTSLEVVQLERQNERLREALLRLRDVTAEHEEELNAKVKQLEEENYDLLEISVQYEKVKQKLDLAESQIEDLRQRLDDALGAEDLVEQLTEKNLQLTERLEELNSANDELEALKELADELEENHVETEKQLQAEIDHRDMLLREQLVRIKACDETNLDYENTIQQFRELVQNLQYDLDQMRQKYADQENEKMNLASQSQEMMSLNMQLQSTVMKAQAKQIDLELRKLEAAQANDRLSYIQPYLPDAFMRTENDPISCLLLFKRLVFKSELIIKHLDQTHPVSEKIMENVSESLVSVCELRQKAAYLSDMAKRFVTFIKHCTPDEFLKMARVYHDLVGSERKLNALVEFFRTDEANDSDSILDLQRIIAHLEHLAEIHLTKTTEADNADLFYGLTRALDMNADKMMVELTFVRQLVYNAANTEGMIVTEGLVQMDYDYVEPLGRLVAETKTCKMISKKLMRQLDDLSEQALTAKADHMHRFKTMYALSSKLSRFCFEVLKQILGYLDSKRANREEISLKELQRIVYNKADDILDISETIMWDGCLKMLKSLSNELTTTLKRIDHDNRMDKIATGIPPWVQRASDMKAEVMVNHDLERKLQQHTEEIFKLIKDVKMKDQALQEASIKVDLLERRMDAAKKEAEQIMTLEENLEKARAQTQMYSEAMENLQAEYEGLEQENLELKKLVSVSKEDKRKSLNAKPRAFDDEATTDSVAFSSVNSQELVNMHSQMEILKAGIRYLRAENAHLKSCDLARTLQLDTLPKTGVISARDTIRSIATESRILLKDMRTVGASPKVVSLVDGERLGRWQSMKKTPDYQYQTQQSVLYTLKQRSEQLQSKLSHLQHTSDDKTQRVVSNIQVSLNARFCSFGH